MEGHLRATFQTNETFKRNILIIFVFILISVLSVFSGVFLANKMKSETLFGNVEVEMDKPELVGHVNILLLGLDGDGTRSDVLMFMGFDNKNKKITVLSIPRDTRVQIGKSYQKINAAIGIGAKGVKIKKISEPEELTIQKVKELIKLPIHYFITLDFKGFRNIIDIFGGVDFDIPDVEGDGKGMNYNDPYQNLRIHLKPGIQHLNGAMAEGVVRYRRGYINADLGRIQTQQSFVKEFIKQKFRPYYLTKAKSIYEELKRHMRTNYTLYDLARHISIIRQLKPENIECYSLPGDSKLINGIWYFIPDIKATQNLILERFKN